MSRDLSQAEIIAATCRLINRDGVDSFSMRRLAAELKRSPMATYYHVDNKDELLAQAADSVLGRVVLPADNGPWRGRILALTMAVWEHIKTNRWIPGFIASRGITTPHLDRILAEMRAILRDPAVDQDVAEQAEVLLWSFVLGLISWAPDPEPHIEFGLKVILDGLPTKKA